MAFDFPSSPTVGQKYQGYTWDGEKWDGGGAATGPTGPTGNTGTAGTPGTPGGAGATGPTGAPSTVTGPTGTAGVTGATGPTGTGGGGGASISIADAPPGSPTAGSMWWESDTGTLWIYYNDGNTSQWVAAAGSGGSVSILRGYIDGLILSNNVSDAVNDIDIAAGMATDSTNAVYMTLASGLTKRLDAAWAVGTNQGGLDTGTIADTTYHVHLIRRSDTGVVDALFSTSAMAPTMPASYNQWRRIGSIRRIGGTIKGFVQNGDNFMWKVCVQDVVATNPGTAAVTRTLTLPTGIIVEALITVMGNGVSMNADYPGGILITDLSMSDTVPSLSNFTMYAYAGVAAQLASNSAVQVYTNISAQIRTRIQNSTAGTSLYVITNGWNDNRGCNT